MADVREYSLGVLDQLVDEGVKMLVIACNTASAAVLRDARERYSVPVVEVIQPAVRAAVAATRNHKVGVIGTTATITTSTEHSIAVGDSVTIALATGPTGFAALNGTWTVTAAATTTTFTFTTVTTGTITSGAATGTIYRLVRAWLPGTYVKINAPSLDLSNIILYIPSITMRFAEGGQSYQVQYEIEADYRRQYLKGLSVLIGAD